MSDDTPTAYPGQPGEGHPGPRLNPEQIDHVLADFRQWLTDGLLTAPTLPVTPTVASDSVDLFTLVGQFTALRHEVNLLTKASRTAIEQNTETLKRLTPAEKPPTEKPAAEKQADTDELFRPLAKAMIDISDALMIAFKQVEKTKTVLEPLLSELVEPTLPPVPDVAAPPELGFWSRLFGVPHVPVFALQKWATHAEAVEQRRAATTNEVTARLQPLLTGIADGYAMSLRRIERVLPQFAITSIESLGKPFDPELMEVVEVVESSTCPSGQVVEEVRRGYRWKEKIFRFAQVKVAR